MTGWVAGAALALYAAGVGAWIGWRSGSYGWRQTAEWLRENRRALHAQYLAEQLDVLEQQRLKIQQYQTRRLCSYTVFMLLVCGLFWVSSASIEQALLQSVVLSALTWLAAVDIDRHAVPERGLVVLAVGLLATHVLYPSLRWSSSDSILMGALVVATLIGFSTFVVRLLRVTDSKEPVFGDGDAIALMALTVGYGVDVVTVFAVASALNAVAYVFNNAYIRLLSLMGHIPLQNETTIGRNHMAFFPFIVMGVVVMVLLTWSGCFQLSAQWNDVYRWWVLI